jgi:hypothetical protein
VDNAYASYLAGPTSITLTTAWSRFKITGSGVAQAVPTASYDASTSGLVRGDAVFLEFYLANEEQVNVISVDMVNRTFTAIATKNYPAADRRPLDGNDLAFDIKAVASPNAGSDLTVVAQT